MIIESLPYLNSIVAIVFPLFLKTSQLMYFYEAFFKIQGIDSPIDVMVFFLLSKVKNPKMSRPQTAFKCIATS